MTSDQGLEQQIRHYLDQQTADIAALRVMLQVLIWNIVRRDPQGAGILAGLKGEVMSTLSATLRPPAPGEQSADVERLRLLTLVRAEQAFDDIERALSAGRLGGTPPG